MSVPTAPGFYWYLHGTPGEWCPVMVKGASPDLGVFVAGSWDEWTIKPDDDPARWGPRVAEPAAVAALEARLARIAEHDLQMDKCWICGSDEWVHDGRAHWQIESGLCPIQAPQ